MTTRVGERLAAEGREPLRVAHGYTLRFIGDHPHTTTMAVSVSLGVSTQAGSRIIAELEDWDLVTRGTNAEDRRTQPLALTEAGKRYLERATQLLHEDPSSARPQRRAWAEIVGLRRIEALERDLLAYLGEAGIDETVKPLR